MNMETDSLRWFQQVADGTTVTEVSELEQVTQLGVSRALARLEAEIGTPLLQRSGRTPRMTHAGSVFKRHVDAMLHQLDDGIAAVNQLIEPDTGTVALAFQHSLATWLVPDLVRSFRAAHPNVRFQLTQVRDELHAPPLAGGHAELEIGTRHPHEPGIPDPADRHRAAPPGPPARPSARPAGRASRWPTLADEPFVGLRARPPRCAGSQTSLCGQRPASRPAEVFEARRPVHRPRLRGGRPGRRHPARAPRRDARGGHRAPCSAARYAAPRAVPGDLP